ncbi:agmatine deiminase [Actinotalea ferrariae CF5-4]|uniref:Agmatine deiminase n=1 Tax=Actinotalea ferrariae CF5-4 TaxID=948458 RepID=A0A021VR76_9CELL|nr:agmatine deiminase family protein [Actinotalea ferrariae]EYR63704.1 agmatine deiminase [Actinotalea ferrariae CF5-4]
MPAEWELHERTWMAWPSGGYTLGETPSDADAARGAWAAVANAVGEHEPVTMVVAAHELGQAERLLSSSVDTVVLPLDDAWMRDIGPTFVRAPDGAVAAVTWVFNGWGQQDWASWEHDARIGSEVARLAGVETVPSTLVNEGGGLHVDGRGTVLVTETVQRDPARNPGWSRADVEAELARTVGARRVVWLPRGLTRDSERYGTRGHVDIVATVTPRGAVLLHDQRDPAHPDHAVCATLRRTLEAAADAEGRPLEVVPLPAPRTLRDADGWVDWSYVNHYVLNGAVVACAFDDPADDEAAAVLAEAYPGRVVVRVDARPLFDRGGGVHCITQQQPARLSTGGPREEEAPWSS